MKGTLCFDKISNVSEGKTVKYLRIVDWKWKLTPVFLSEKLNGQRSLVSYSLWGHKESEMAVIELAYLNSVPHLLIIWASRVYYVHFLKNSVTGSF